MREKHISDDALKEQLVKSGLRPTRQRLVIGRWLFNGGDKHFTAEDLHRHLLKNESRVSLATIYNTLGSFIEAGLLQTVNLGAGRVFYDTNMHDHYHVYHSDKNALTDLEPASITVSNLPVLPKGEEIDQIDIIIRTRPVRKF